MKNKLFCLIFALFLFLLLIFTGFLIFNIINSSNSFLTTKVTILEKNQTVIKEIWDNFNYTGATAKCNNHWERVKCNHEIEGYTCYKFNIVTNGKLEVQCSNSNNTIVSSETIGWKKNDVDMSYYNGYQSNTLTIEISLLRNNVNDSELRALFSYDTLANQSCNNFMMGDSWKENQSVNYYRINQTEFLSGSELCSRSNKLLERHTSYEPIYSDMIHTNIFNLVILILWLICLTSIFLLLAGGLVYRNFCVVKKKEEQQPVEDINNVTI